MNTISGCMTLGKEHLTVFLTYGAESVPKIEIFYEGEIFRDIPR